MKIILDKNTAEKMLKDGFDEFVPSHISKNQWEFCDDTHCARIERISKRKYKTEWIRRYYPYMPEFENFFETFDEALAYARIMAEAIKTASKTPETSIIEGEIQSVKKLVDEGKLLLCDCNPLEKLIAYEYTKAQDTHTTRGFDESLFICIKKMPTTPP
jgi:hypothetical protein